jgi:hypothetical protein
VILHAGIFSANGSGIPNLKRLEINGPSWDLEKCLDVLLKALDDIAFCQHIKEN